MNHVEAVITLGAILFLTIWAITIEGRLAHLYRDIYRNSDED